MPGGDKTGPTGAGPMSGRGGGYCARNDQPGYLNNAIDRGRRFGLGRGQGGLGRGRGQGGFGSGQRQQGRRFGWLRNRNELRTDLDETSTANPIWEEIRSALKGLEARLRRLEKPRGDRED